MNMRNLKVDLERHYEVLSKGEVPDMDIHDLALEARARAIKAEKSNDMLVKYNKFLTAEVLGEQKRVEQLESLVRELAEVLRLYERWEAEVIMDNSLWQSASGLPFITQEVWDELVAIQTERNRVLQKSREVVSL